MRDDAGTTSRSAVTRVRLLDGIDSMEVASLERATSLYAALMAHD